MRFIHVVLIATLCAGCPDDGGDAPGAGDGSTSISGDGGTVTGWLYVDDYHKVVFLRAMVCDQAHEFDYAIKSGGLSHDLNHKGYVRGIYACIKASKSCEEYDVCLHGMKHKKCSQGSPSYCDGNNLISCERFKVDGKERHRLKKFDCSQMGQTCGMIPGAKQPSCLHPACSKRPSQICSEDTFVGCGMMGSFDLTIDCAAMKSKCSAGSICVDSGSKSCAKDDKGYCMGTKIYICGWMKKAMPVDCALSHPNLNCAMDKSKGPQCKLDQGKVTCTKKGIWCEGNSARMCVLGKEISIDCGAFMNSKCITDTKRTGCAADVSFKKDFGPEIDGYVTDAGPPDSSSKIDGTVTDKGPSPPKTTCKWACKKDADCGSVLKCQTATGKCVNCMSDADCTFGLNKCDTTSGQCRLCAKDTDCAISGIKIQTGKCDPKSSLCLKCSADLDCQFTNSTTKKCVKGVCKAVGCDSVNCPFPLKCVGDTCTCGSDADCKSAIKLDAYKCK